MGAADWCTRHLNAIKIEGARLQTRVQIAVERFSLTSSFDRVLDRSATKETVWEKVGGRDSTWYAPKQEEYVFDDWGGLKTGSDRIKCWCGSAPPPQPVC